MKQWIYFATVLGVIFTFSEACAEKPYVNVRMLSMDMANRVAVSAAAACRKQGFQVAVAVVDRAGKLLAFVRDPLAGSHTIDVSQRKAYTSATYQSSTATMMKNTELRFTPGIILLRGGLPIRVGGHFYGAVGVSGAPGKTMPGDADEECAQAGIDEIRDALEFAE